MSSGVLFGGPTPEHDISILTGLQALRELSRTESDVCGIYWTKTGSYFLVANDVEAEAFLDGRYSRAHEWTFDGGARVPASSRPHVVPLPFSDTPASILRKSWQPRWRPATCCSSSTSPVERVRFSWYEERHE